MTNNTYRKNRYKMIFLPDHPRAHVNGQIREHTLLAEVALGKPLPEGAVVHHHTKDQLVICQDQAYHLLLHQRQRAYKACGHANWRKCTYCKQYSDPKDLTICKNSGPIYHKECNTNYYRERRLNGGY